MDLSQLSKYPSEKENEKEEKRVKRKTKRYKDKKIYINKNKNIKKNKNKHFYNKKSLSDSKIKIQLKNIQNRKKNYKIFIDEEINGFTYNLAIEYDKRTYCQYYSSLLKTQHSLICALFNNTDYNSRIIKIKCIIL